MKMHAENDFPRKMAPRQEASSRVSLCHFLFCLRSAKSLMKTVRLNITSATVSLGDPPGIRNSERKRLESKN